ADDQRDTHEDHDRQIGCEKFGHLDVPRINGDRSNGRKLAITPSAGRRRADRTGGTGDRRIVTAKTRAFRAAARTIAFSLAKQGGKHRYRDLRSGAAGRLSAAPDRHPADEAEAWPLRSDPRRPTIMPGAETLASGGAAMNMREDKVTDWRAMREAPRDGSRILATVRASEQGPAEVDVVRWTAPRGAFEPEWIATDSDPACLVTYGDDELVAWMPIPSPTLPSAAAETSWPQPANERDFEEESGSGI
ncbi:hypothetical protein, partial [Aurantimonas coralicida]|uniref:hypothetical protein n=2 Tax=Aurantimonadaceae TaxID=255475 RepID=UPI00239FE551